MEVKCWNCEEEIDVDEKVRKIEGNRVCEECWEHYKSEQKEDPEADYWDTKIKERKYGG